MSKELTPRPKNITQRKHVTIVASVYNEEFTNALVENCLAELKELMLSSRFEVIRVPGAFEIPVVLQAALDRTRRHTDVAIALGVIIKGSTAHAELVGTTVTNALMDISLKTKIPVIHEVLLLDDEKQAFARCIASNMNRGREAARAASQIVDLYDALIHNRGGSGIGSTPMGGL